jgi:hypothetical protein
MILQDMPNSVLQNKERVRVLDISGNRFTEVPATVGTMPSLERLTASQNQIAAISCHFGTLQRLRVRSIKQACLRNWQEHSVYARSSLTWHVLIVILLLCAWIVIMSRHSAPPLHQALKLSFSNLLIARWHMLCDMPAAQW